MVRILLGVEIVVLLTLLGLWGYRRAGSLQAASDTAISSGEKEGNAGNGNKNVPTSAKSGAYNTASAAADSRSGFSATVPETVAETLPVEEAEAPWRQPWILVEKSRQRLTVFDGQRVVRQYPASTGREPGDKQREGDYRTPEGEFYVCVKNAASKYTRALGLSYPSREDARRGLREGLITREEHDRILYAIDNRRQPPWDTALGGEIMIHGDRRGGRTTQGCIALEDRDILELFPRIPPGTRVVIRP